MAINRFRGGGVGGGGGGGGGDHDSHFTACPTESTSMCIGCLQDDPALSVIAQCCCLQD